ncbi:MAG: sigma-70 family RNA polymerase sigma factor [Erysipelotrichaceae bacterium]|nr:sigma-70 family RNA polymerase sigma factor [Erysipelotrichaceae bacterium]
MDRSVIRYVKEIQAGNDQAFNELYRSIYDDVFRMAYSMVHNQADASDVTQEVFISIHKNLHHLKDPEAFPLWTQRIVFTRCTRLFRKRKDSLMNENNALTLSYEIEKDKDFLPKEKFDDEKEQELIHELVDRLQPKHRDVISCVYFKQMSLKETAGYLKRPEGTIKSQLYTARKELYGYIEDYERKNQRKIKFYDLGTSTTAGLFSWANIQQQWMRLKSTSMFWNLLVVSSTVVASIGFIGAGINAYHFGDEENNAVHEQGIQSKQQEVRDGIMILGRWIATPQDAYFALVDWGVTPEIAKTKDEKEIKEMRKIQEILFEEQGVYWQRFIREGWKTVFE